MEQPDASGYVYVVKLREHIGMGAPVYKIGQTKDVTQRMSDYPSGSALLLTCQTRDRVSCERRMIRSLLVSQSRRMDLGNEYFEGDIGEILMTVTKIAIDVGVRECKRVWRQRCRAPRHHVMNHGRTCEFVMDAFVVSVGGMITGQYRGCRMKLGVIHDHVRAFADREGLLCKTLTASNVGAKLASLYGCKVLQDLGETIIMFPGVVNVDASPPVEQLSGSGSEICSVQSFLEEHCEFGTGLRTSSAELSSKYREWSGRVASDKWFHARLRAMGLVKKSGMRIGSEKVMGYDGICLKRCPPHADVP